MKAASLFKGDLRDLYDGNMGVEPLARHYCSLDRNARWDAATVYRV
jgi:hypothetical protein